MNRMLRINTAALLGLLIVARPGGAQSFEAVGTRAAGMAGAFVAVADDGSAAYWNPAGFASGSYFSLVLDRTSSRTNPEGEPTAGSRSGFLLALGAPALGLSYYRLRATTLRTTDEPLDDRNVRVNSLTTHHVGATLVQSIGPGIAVGATLKVVRGLAGSRAGPAGNRDPLLEDGEDLSGLASNRFDADLGIMATAGRMKAGLTVRNLTQPEFDLRDGGPALRLERQARAGVAVSPVDGWTVAADLDLIKTSGPHGDVRDFAVGAEGRVARRAFARAGARLNMVNSPAVGRTPSVGVGGSYAVTASVLVDAQVTLGSERAHRGWGVAARFVY
jgi:F plasmid transfer operon protein TraF